MIDIVSANLAGNVVGYFDQSLAVVSTCSSWMSQAFNRPEHWEKILLSEWFAEAPLTIHQWAARVGLPGPPTWLSVYAASKVQCYAVCPLAGGKPLPITPNTVEGAMQCIEARCGIPQDWQRLIYLGKQLDHSAMLASRPPRGQRRVFLVGRLGGPPWHFWNCFPRYKAGPFMPQSSRIITRFHAIHCAFQEIRFKQGHRTPGGLYMLEMPRVELVTTIQRRLRDMQCTIAALRGWEAPRRACTWSIETDLEWPPPLMEIDKVIESQKLVSVFDRLD